MELKSLTKEEVQAPAILDLLCCQADAIPLPGAFQTLFPDQKLKKKELITPIGSSVGEIMVLAAKSQI
ncbi:hypothetical protein P6709_20310, partial [Jeotgalibacillus sp. ET6]|uniref:hypothetical protein n=1 Tax=Jeotgalibacillus sp. ET6 TaxID=3037260 RepID=UPI002418613D